MGSWAGPWEGAVVLRQEGWTEQVWTREAWGSNWKALRADQDAVTNTTARVVEQRRGIDPPVTIRRGEGA